jgi:nucleoside phosphorylase
MEQLAVKRLVLVGWGGGLTAGLNAGDVLCASIALHAGKQPVTCTPPTGGKIRAGPILTSAKALLTPAEKRAAADTGALAVEMEAYPLAVWANQHSIPFMHGRVILDTWDETLPDLSLNASGGVSPIELLKLVAKRPAVLAELARLNRRVQMLDPLLARLAFDLILD